MLQVEVDPDKADGAGGELLVAAGAVRVHFDPPGVAGVATLHRVRRVDAGHEIEWLARSAGCRGRNVDVPEKPGVKAGIAEVAFGHVEIALVGIEPEALDVAVGDADVQGVPCLLPFPDPADPVILAVFAGAWAGIEADLVVVALKILGGRFSQGQHATALGSGTKLFPEFAIRSFAKVVVAREDENCFPLELDEGLHRLLDLGLGDGGFIEQITRDHDEVGLAVVRGGDHPFERGEALLDQASPGRLGILAEGEADVVVGGVKNAKTHKVEDSVGLNDREKLSGTADKSEVIFSP